LADVAALSADFFSVDEEAIKWIESVLTVVGGKVVYAAGDFEKLGPASVPVLPDWSPVVKVPGHWRPNSPLQAQVHQCSGPARCTPTAMKKRDCRTHRSVTSPVSGARSAARALRSDEYKKAPARWPGATCNIHPPRSFL
jgi:hypothetical protein